jgi:hypothetical protein
MKMLKYFAEAVVIILVSALIGLIVGSPFVGACDLARVFMFGS